MAFAAISSCAAHEATCPDRLAISIVDSQTLALPRGAATTPFHILAIGSSSTEGVGASSKEKAYPARLEADLRADGWRQVEVRNAGVGGETAADMMVRLKAALNSGWPQLTIWQVGTNSALRGVDLAAFRAQVEEGVRAARAAHAPMILIDPQFTVREESQAQLRPYTEIVDAIGKAARLPVARRYISMSPRVADGTPEALLSKDGLHMNDLGYDCLASSLAAAIAGETKLEATR